ncbi:thermolysin [Tumebacillus sp. BK434]|uniref:M4 family metallopeptidase n=1 Tax=Tumebacillus sp. BK434 TaxID=2512169 RepID=UPI001048AC8D|nr:M4 family metallopeptidase [Tumebacillus sp. BK434]TCP57637.1 thermolysin [Tumebacillus sp. BK434]
MNKKLIATMVMTSVLASAFAMSSAGAANDKQVLKDEKGQVHNVVGKLGKVEGTTPEARALNALDKAKDVYGFDKAQGNFKAKKSHKDESGTTHTKLDQVIGGIPVFGAEMIVHEANGDVQGITGSFKDLAPKASKAVLKESAAIDKAVAHTGYQGELSEPAKTELVYVAQGSAAVLTYKVSVNYLGEAPGRWSVFVDAATGEIVNSFNQIEHVAGTGTGVLGDTKTIQTTLRSGTYYLEDRSKTAMTGLIQTKTYKNGWLLSYNMTDTDNVWDASNQRAGVDAHYYAGYVYDYYYNLLGRNSYDGTGKTLLSYVNYQNGYNNAYWNGSSMTYGDGDGKNFRAFSGALDVIAHELTHGVTEYTSGLVYQNQSGALNESWSDAMGAVIEGRNWLLGEDIVLPGYGKAAFRSMSDPGAYGDPAHMSQYVNTSADNGGVHTNSGIPNKAFYNFATAIGSRDIAGKIWYIASRDYMTSSTNFSGARAATLSACAALYGTGSSYYSALQNAWTAVGI